MQKALEMKSATDTTDETEVPSDTARAHKRSGDASTKAAASKKRKEGFSTNDVVASIPGIKFKTASDKTAAPCKKKAAKATKKRAAEAANEPAEVNMERAAEVTKKAEAVLRMVRTRARAEKEKKEEDK